MLNRVHRYELCVGKTTVRMPARVSGARAPLLHVDIKADQEVISLWALHANDDVGLHSRTFHVVGTGHTFEGRGLAHVGSCLDESRQYVWHVFEDLDAMRDGEGGA